MDFASLPNWYEIKQFLAHGSGFSMDALHVIAGVTLQVLVAALLRRSLASWLPLLAVLLFELGNEANDLRVEAWPEPPMQYGEGAKDVVLTMALPLLLFLLARRRPALLSGPPSAPAAPSAQAGTDRA